MDVTCYVRYYLCFANVHQVSGPPSVNYIFRRYSRIPLYHGPVKHRKFREVFPFMILTTITLWYHNAIRTTWYLHITVVMGQNMNVSLNPRMTPHTSPWRANYGVPFVMILEKIDRVITAPHCTYIILGQSYTCLSASEATLKNMAEATCKYKFPTLKQTKHTIILSVLYGIKVQYIPRKMHTVFALLCFVVVVHWLIFPYPSGLLHWHCGNLTIAPVPANNPDEYG